MTKSKDPDCRIPISKEEFRCFKCDYPSPNDKGGWNEIEPGLTAKVCADCYKPKKDTTNVKEEKDDIQVGQTAVEGSECSDLQPLPTDVRTSPDL